MILRCLSPALVACAALLFTIAPAARAQDRELPLEDVLRQKAGHFSLTAAWIGGGAYDLRFPNGTQSGAGPTVQTFNGSAGAALNWTYLGERSSAWANYSGDYSRSSLPVLSSLSQAANAGFLRKVSPRFSIGLLGTFQQMNLGALLFAQPQQSKDLTSSAFGSNTGGLGSSTDPVGQTIGAVPGASTYGLTLGGNQRQYTVGLASSYLISPQTDVRFSASAGQSQYLATPGVTVQLPYSRSTAGYGLVTIRHEVSKRTAVFAQLQGSQTRAQQTRLNTLSGLMGISYRLATSLRLDLAGGGGASTAFQLGVAVPWVFRYTDLARLTYATPKQGLVLLFMQDAGDRVALGFQGTSQLNIFWNIRPPASNWAFSARAGGVILQAMNLPDTKAGTLQAGLSRRLVGNVYAFAEATYVTNVLFAQQRLLQLGAAASVVDTTAQRAARLSIVYRPSHDRK